MPCNSAARRGAWGGFTLVEMMIALAILAVLASIALPSYLESARKGRRADALAALQQVEQAQERWRAGNPAYAATLAELNLRPASPAGHYTLSLSGASATGYTVTANAAPGSPQAGDSRCLPMSVTRTGGDVVYAPAASTGCWSR